MSTRRWSTIAVAAVVLVAAGAASSALADSAAYPAAILAASANPIKAELAAKEQALTAQREAVAADPVKRQGLIDAKAQVGAQQRKAATATAATNGVAAEPGAEAATGWPTGIFQDTEAPAPGGVFLGTNRWVGPVAGTTVAVYAGVSGSDPTTGRLLVVVEGPTLDPTTVDLPGSGALTATSADGDLLTVTDASGATHVFDVAARAWQG